MSPERFARINELLDQRQPDLTLCLESVHKNHNLSALIRTADAVGIPEVHAVWYDRRERIRKGTAMGSQKWVQVHHYDNLKEAVDRLKSEGKQVVVTNLSAQAVDFRSLDYTRPTAVIMGQERHGVTDEAIALADHEVVIPMVGMAESLNVSVAAAIVLYEAQRQRVEAGMYRQPRLAASERNRVLFEGGHPIFARICKRKNLAYPDLDEQGQIVADDSWWQAVKASR
ncbi:tRNA (guanosine(18)-2'-O)-methyltransferase TrmH [Pseudidiomarina sp.]|uniref:tRNA (guanosine(18)-2'-O)-methyltransferase TrmH n=1 Tax=Pseudidiomarina sp. TaxID=2081707 RepID=UPI00299DD773|nr:tRNA (guanosine(18)-2'-O)-methyltransferase TrmH [Pseudidiomarina sp.]MDX1705406.1 tRNA (guanosine(18)-2'-O)-methyltransferase TrmH [Pseudidiomarina sp.]